MSASNPFQVTDIIEKDNKLFLKVWLLDDTVNKLGWGIDRDYLSKHIRTAINKPVILNREHYHPFEFDRIKSASIQPYLEAQKQYQVGEIKDVYQDKILPNNYHALVEITDKRLIDAYHKGDLKIPRYVSPSVFSQNPIENGPIKDYEFLHIAFVDDPAYGIGKAYTRGDCFGTQQTCATNLAQASSSNSTPCECPVGEFSNFKNTFQAGTNSSYSNTEPKTQHTALTDQTIQENKPVDAQTNTTVETNKPVEVQNQQTKTEQVKTEVENRAPIKVESPVNTQVVEEKKTEEVSKVDNSEINTLKEQLSALKSTIEELRAFKEERVKAEQETKEKSKRELIEEYVTPDSCNGNEEERAKRIAALMHIPDADLKSFLETHYILPETPCSKVKQAGISKRRITDFSAQPKVEESKVKQAGIMTDESKLKASRVMQFLNSSSNSGGRFS